MIGSGSEAGRTRGGQGEGDQIRRGKRGGKRMRSVPGTDDGEVVLNTLVVDKRVLVEGRHGDLGSTDVASGRREGAREAGGTKPNSTNRGCEDHAV